MNDRRGVEAKKVVLEIRNINSSICGFEGMYRFKGTVGQYLMVPFFVSEHTKTVYRRMVWYTGNTVLCYAAEKGCFKEKNT